jgi:hypothetical protein
VTSQNWVYIERVRRRLIVTRTSGLNFRRYPEIERSQLGGSVPAERWNTGPIVEGSPFHR